MRSDHTKQILADSLEELAKTTPLSKITVQMICENCGLSRRTFYYHFDERQDLIDWVYANDREQSVRETSAQTLQGNLMRLAACFSERPELYSQIVSASGETTPRDYFYQATFDCWLRLFRSHLGERAELVSNKELEMIASFFVNGTIGVARNAPGDGRDFGELFRRYFELLLDLLDDGLYGMLDKMAAGAEER